MKQDDLFSCYCMLGKPDSDVMLRDKKDEILHNDLDIYVYMYVFNVLSERFQIFLYLCSNNTLHLDKTLICILIYCAVFIQRHVLQLLKKYKEIPILHHFLKFSRYMYVYRLQNCTTVPSTKNNTILHCFWNFDKL